MEHRLVLNNRTITDITNSDMCGIFRQQLKYVKFRRVTTKTGKSIFYLFFRKEEETYAALRAAKMIKDISLVRYRPANLTDDELPFRPFPPKKLINMCRYAFRKYLDRFNTMELFKTFVRRLSEQIMAQYTQISSVQERIDKLHLWWWMNKQFSVKDNYSIQKLLDIFFS